MDQTDIAWAAGFYEGEGNCHATIKKGARPTGSLSVSVCQTHKEPINKFLEVFTDCGGKIYFEPRSGNRSGLWRLAYHGQNAKFVFTAMAPYLSQRRIDQYNEQLDRLEETRVIRESIPKTPRIRLTQCRKGHEFTEENLYVDPRGTRHCRTCRREAQVRHYAKSR